MREGRLAVTAMAAYMMMAAAAAGGAEAPAVPKLKVVWAHHVADEVRTFGAEGTVYVASGRTFSAVDLTTGHERWRIVMKGASQSRPVEVGGTVAILVSDDAETRPGLAGFSAASGEELWMVKAKKGFWADGFPIESKGSAICFEDRDGTLYAVDSPAGKLKWSKARSHDGIVASFPIVAGDAVMWHDGDVLALDVETGAVRWTYRDAYLIGATSRTAFAMSRGGDGDPSDVHKGFLLRGLGLDTGAVKWEVPMSSASCFDNGLCAMSNGVLLRIQEKRLIARDADTGQELWADGTRLWPSATSVQTDGTTVCYTAVAARRRSPGAAEEAPNRGIEYGDEEDKGVTAGIRALDLKAGKLLWERPGKCPSYVVAVQGGLVYLYEEGRLLIVDARSGESKWQVDYPDSWGLPGDIFVGKDAFAVTVDHGLRGIAAPGLQPPPREEQTGPNSNVEW